MIIPISNKILLTGVSKNTSDLLAIALLYFVLFIIIWTSHAAIKRYIVSITLSRVNGEEPLWISLLIKHAIPIKLSYIFPLLIGYLLIPVLEYNEFSVCTAIYNIVVKILLTLIILTINLIIITLFDLVNDLYNQFFLIAKDLPIKTYLQVAKMLCWLISLILVVSTLGDKSPISMLTGLGAISAILMFTFKDSILGLVSSIQVSAYDIARIGDWITISNQGIDGEVIDISLNIVKIRKFDKTIVTFPTQELMQQGVTNWRGMVDSGGRRIKRSIHIDINFIKFCDKKLLDSLFANQLIYPYINNQEAELGNRNTLCNSLDKEILYTNIGLYRKYIKGYLSKRADIYCDGFSFLIRQLQSTSEGIPIEIYVFTITTNWVEYEEIQADIIEHLIAILPLFQLKIFQKMSANNCFKY